MIRLINDWPDSATQFGVTDKVPSSICYVDGLPQRWGYSVGLTDESFKCIKILLERDNNCNATVGPLEDTSVLLKKIHKEPHEVAGDYLRLLWEHTKKNIRTLYPDWESIFATRIILTVPAVWSPAAKNQTRLAAKLAGFPDKITLVTEPEAAALAVLGDKVLENSLRVCFLLRCNADNSPDMSCFLSDR